MKVLAEEKAERKRVEKEYDRTIIEIDVSASGSQIKAPKHKRKKQNTNKESKPNSPSRKKSCNRIQPTETLDITPIELMNASNGKHEYIDLPDASDSK